MISTKGRYAVRVMIDLAEQNSANPVTLDSIAMRQNISKKYLESIVKNLVKQGLLKSSSGKGGGYLLTRDPEMYNILEILEATELTMAPAACLEKGAKECTRRHNCKTLHMWTNYYELTKRYFSGITIKDLIQEKPLDFVI